MLAGRIYVVHNLTREGNTQITAFVENEYYNLDLDGTFSRKTFSNVRTRQHKHDK